MFSYLYTDSNNGGRGLHFFVTAKTKETIERAALDNIRNMAIDNGAPGGPPELKEVMDAITANDAQKAMAAWDRFITTDSKIKVAIHKIEPIKLVE